MKRPGYIPTLDGWRAIAIGLVLGAHSGPALEALGNPVATKVAHLLVHTGFGVDVFFALSGYLICTLLLEEKRRCGGHVSLGRFYVRRAFRILPPVFTYLLGLVALHSAGVLNPLSRSEVLSVVAFVRNYSDGDWYTGHFWSLAIEEHFYLIIPLLLASLRYRTLLVVTVVLSAASVGWRAFEFRHDFLHSYFPHSFIQFRTENRFDGLMNGAILALLLHHKETRDRLARLLSPALLVAACVAGVGLNIYGDMPLRRTVAALVLPLLIAHTVLRPGEFAGRMLELSPIRWIGRLSFSLYLWQQLFLVPEYLPHCPGLLGSLQRHVWSTLPALACAVASYYLVERPMFRIGHRLAASPSSPPERDAAALPEPAEPAAPAESASPR